jgi:uncharacterized protein (DUF433 family)
MATTSMRAVRLEQADEYTGIYTVADAALYLRATTPPPGTPLSVWQQQPDRFIGPSSRQLHGWIRQSIGAAEDVRASARVVTFEELVRLRMITLLRAHGVSFSAIVRAEYDARWLTGSPQPFVTEPVWTFGSDVILRIQEGLVAASKRGQLALPILEEFLRPVEHGLRFDAHGVAAAWQSAPGVLLAPGILFGSPCIEGTRIATEVIWSMSRAGETVASLAEMYKLPEPAIDEALSWEKRLARAA